MVLTQEFRERMEKTRKIMRSRELEALIAYSNTKLCGHVRYLSNYAVNFAGYHSIAGDELTIFGNAIIVLPLEGEPVLLTDEDPNLITDSPRARDISYIHDVRASIEYAKDICNILEKSGVKSGRIGVEGWKIFPAPIDRELRLLLPNVEIERSTILEEMRMVKSPTEISSIREAVRITDIGAKAAAEAIEEGKTEWDLAIACEFAMKKSGAEDLAFTTIIGSGVRTALGVPLPTNRKMEKGDLVMIDVGGKYGGYCGDITRMKVFGKPSEKQKDLYNVVMDMHAEALKKAKPGVKACEVHEATLRVSQQAGYGKYVTNLTGHGVGLEIHERPDFGVDETRLVPNMVVTIEPGLMVPGFGGIRIEDTVLTTDSGVEVLTKYTKEL